MSFMGMKLLSHMMKLLHLMTLPDQQFCLCGTLFNVPGVDGRPIVKNTNYWESTDGVSSVDGRPMGSSQERLAAGCRQTRTTSTCSGTRTSRQFSNAKCEQA